MLIWEMADLDQDGKLTKLEFCLAFHLTNVRRNGFPLPHAVPESLFISLAGTMIKKPLILIFRKFSYQLTNYSN